MARSVLRRARNRGLTAPGGPLEGLPDTFALYESDTPQKVERDPDDEIGRSLPNTVIKQLTSPTAIARLAEQSDQNVADATELLIRTGRRPAEICHLPEGCLRWDQRVREDGTLDRRPVLVYRPEKTPKRSKRLPVHAREALIITRAQERARARFPDVTAGKLPLFPRGTQNRSGTVPISAHRVSRAVHDWSRALPELLDSDRTELANGFFNRFLVLAVDRSKLLPFGSAIDDEHLAEIRDAVRLALRFAASHRPIRFDDAARERWVAAYGELSAGQPGLAGAATARAEAHVVRLSLIYALLDCSERICIEHLDAALAVWRYSSDSARWIFGDSLGDPTADEIWAAAKERPVGVTRTEVSDMFSRNKKRREIERALGVLEDAGRLRRETRQPDRGRSAEVWIPVPAEAA